MHYRSGRKRGQLSKLSELWRDNAWASRWATGPKGACGQSTN